MAFQIIMGLVCGAICGALAAHKGRSVIIWVLLGFLFGLIPLIIILCLANLKEQRARHDRDRRERARLREQVKQEKIKNESFRQYTATRLDTHDQALGMNSRAQPALAAGETEAPPPIAVEVAGHVQPTQEAQAIWYYESNGESRGPVSEMVIRGFLKSNRLRPETLLWKEGLAAWTPSREIQEFQGGVL
jgi:uncharacterized protein DUF4339